MVIYFLLRLKQEITGDTLLFYIATLSEQKQILKLI